MNYKGSSRSSGKKDKKIKKEEEIDLIEREIIEKNKLEIIKGDLQNKWIPDNHNLLIQSIRLINLERVEDNPNLNFDRPHTRSQLGPIPIELHIVTKRKQC